MTRLRQLERSDAPRLCALWTGERSLPGYQLPGDEEKMTALIDEWNRCEIQGRRFEMLLIEDEGVPAGLVSLYEQGENVSLGIAVHPSMQHRGIGTRAVLLAAEYARLSGRERLISQCRTDNIASIALHEKCGFQRMGERMNSKGNRVIDWALALKEEIEKE